MGANPLHGLSSRQRSRRESSSLPWPLALLGFVFALYFNDRSVRYKSYRAALASTASSDRARRSGVKPVLLMLLAVLLLATGLGTYSALQAASQENPPIYLEAGWPAVTPEAAMTAISEVLATPTSRSGSTQAAYADGPRDPDGYLQDALNFIERYSIMPMDWPAWRAKVLAKAGKPITTADTHSAIRDALESLGDSHSQFWEPAVYLNARQNAFESPKIVPTYPERSVDFVGDRYPAGWGSMSYEAGVRSGDVIESINGQPAASMGASMFYRALYSGSHVRLTLSRKGIAVPITIAYDHPYLSRYRVPEGRRLEGNIGYIQLPTNGERELSAEYPAIVQQIIRDLDQQPVCGWVVDLQDNTGGSLAPMLAGIGPILGEGEAGSFIDRRGRHSRWQYVVDDRYDLETKSSHKIGRAYVGTGGPQLVDRPYFYHVNKQMPPVAVLTDRWTASAGEAILISFRGRPNTRTFGEPTYGVPSANSSKLLSDWSLLVVTTAQEADRTGRVYKYNERIQPDQFVTPGSPDDQGTDADPVLAAGAKWLRGQPACAR